MDNQVWEKGIQEYLPNMEGFLKDILLKKVKAEMAAAQLTDPSNAIEALKTGTLVVHSKENNFNSGLFIAFDENWIPQLSMAMLGVEEKDVNEISRDLIKEFSSQLVGNIQLALSESGIEIAPGDLELTKSGQIANAVGDKEYFMAQIDVTGKFVIDGDEQPQLAMIIAIAVPDQDKIDEFLSTQEDDEAAESQKEESLEEEPVAETSDEVVDEGDIDDLFGEDSLFDESIYTDVDDPTEEAAKEESDKKQAPAKASAKKKKKTGPPVEGRPVEFDEFNHKLSSTSDVETRNLDILKDVELDISVELGRKSVPLGDILHYVRGSVIELDKLAGEPVEIYANGRRIAEGEVVVIDENFGVRITNLVSTRERIESLR